MLDLLGRGRAVRPPVDALGASDRLGGARAGELALLSAGGRRRDPAARRPGGPAVGGPVANGQAPTGRRADLPGGRPRRGSGDGRGACSESGRWSASRERSLREAAARMEDEGVSSILVDLGDGELGIVTDRDLRSKVVAAGRSPEISVGEVMTAPVFTATAEQTSAELMLTMIDRGIRHVPVVSAAAGSCSASPPTSTCSPPRPGRRSCSDARSPTQPTSRRCARRRPRSTRR